MHNFSNKALNHTDKFFLEIHKANMIDCCHFIHIFVHQFLHIYNELVFFMYFICLFGIIKMFRVELSKKRPCVKSKK